PGRQDPAERIQELRQLCWQVAGVERQGPSLRQARIQVRAQRQELEASPLLAASAALEPGHGLELDSDQASSLEDWQELYQRLVVAERLIEAAAFREESRGGHYRTDAPSPQPFWQRHTLQQRGCGISTAPVPGEAARVPAPGNR
ncbi:MAG: hypothetical protein R6W06_10415, partial [Prochlorococcaceae cyanobacterium]